MSLLRLMAGDPSKCPYYTKGQKCDRGCWEEPRCITEEPEHGWPWDRLKRKARKV